MADSIQMAPYARSNTDLRSSVYAGSNYDASMVDMSEERFILVRHLYNDHGYSA